MDYGDRNFVVLEVNIKSLFEFIYDKETNTIYAKKTNYYDELHKNIMEKSDRLHSDTLINICYKVTMYTYDKYSELKQETGGNLVRFHEDVDFIIDDLLKRKEYELLIDNIRFFNPDNVKKIERAVMATKNMKLIAALGATPGNIAMKKYLESVILSSRDYKNIYLYGVMRKDNPSMKIINALMEDNHGENYCYVYELAKLYNESTIFSPKKIERYFAKNHHYKKLESLYLDVLGKSYDEFIDCLIEFTNGWELCNYAIHYYEKISDDKIKKIEDKLIECNEPNVLCTFASKVPNCDFKRIQEEIIKSRRSKYMYEFAKNVESSDRVRLLEEIEKQGDLIYLYKFERNINNVIREDIINQILKSGDGKSICALSSELTEEYLKACEEQLKKVNDTQYLEYFYINNKNRINKV